MENRKIKVIVQDGDYTREHTGDYAYVQVFEDQSDGTNLCVESCGGSVRGEAVIDGMMQSILEMAGRISAMTDLDERELLGMIGKQLLDRMERLDGGQAGKPDVSITATVVSGEEARKVLEGILAGMKEERR